MTLLLNNDEVEKVLTPEISIQATEAIYRELAEGTAYNRPRSQVYLPAESKNHPGFHYRFKSQEGGRRARISNISRSSSILNVSKCTVRMKNTGGSSPAK